MADHPAPGNDAEYDETFGGAHDEPFDQHASVPQPPAPYRPATQPLTPRTITLILLGCIAAVSIIWVSVHFTWPGITVVVVSALAAIQLGLFAARGSQEDAELAFKKEMATPPRAPERVLNILAPDEQVHVVAHDHPLTVAHWFVAIGLIQVLSGWMIGSSDIMRHGPGLGVAAVLWFAAMIMPVYRLVEWWRTVFVITNKGILLFTGVFTQDHNQMSLAALTDVKARTPWHSVWLTSMRWTKVKYGTFQLETAGQRQAINAVGLMAGIDTLEYILRSLVQGRDPYADEGDGLPYPVSPAE
jgi:hypothetical protein